MKNMKRYDLYGDSAAKEKPNGDFVYYDEIESILSDNKIMIDALKFYSAHMKLGYAITDSGQVAEDTIKKLINQPCAQ